MAKRFYIPSIVKVYVAIFSVFVTLAVCGYYVFETTDELVVHRHTKVSVFSETAYLELPRLKVGVSHGREMHSVMADISLETARKDTVVIEGYLPRITDAISRFFLRLRPDELRKLGTSMELRRELLRQVNSVGAPAPVLGILMRQLVVL